MENLSSTELLKLKTKLERWNYETISMAMLNKDESALVIKLIERRESRAKYHRKRYLERVKGDE